MYTSHIRTSHNHVLYKNVIIELTFVISTIGNFFKSNTLKNITIVR